MLIFLDMFSFQLVEEVFDQEIVSVSIPGRKGTTTLVAKDEQPRPETTVEGLGKLRPAFIRDGTGSVTAGNSSTINDGAAAVVLMAEVFQNFLNRVTIAIDIIVEFEFMDE